MRKPVRAKSVAVGASKRSRPAAVPLPEISPLATKRTDPRIRPHWVRVLRGRHSFACHQAPWTADHALALYRVHRVFSARMNGPHEREYCYTYLRNWLYPALRRTGWKYTEMRPPVMWAWHPPVYEAVAEWKCWRLPAATRQAA